MAIGKIWKYNEMHYIISVTSVIFLIELKSKKEILLADVQIAYTASKIISPQIKVLRIKCQYRRTVKVLTDFS
jgi:hypothetical protein